MWEQRNVTQSEEPGVDVILDLHSSSARHHARADSPYCVHSDPPGQCGQQGCGFHIRMALSLAIVVALTVLVTGNNPPSRHGALTGGHGPWGGKHPHRVAMVLIALRQRRRMGKPRRRRSPRSGNQPRQHVAFVCNRPCHTHPTMGLSRRALG